MSKNIIDLNIQKEYSEMYHADMFEMGLKYKVYTDILPFFENVLREIPCKEGIADFICFKQTGFLTKNSGIICEINDLVGKSFDVDLWAFELKLKNWKRALYQATQYKSFSSNVFTVFPNYKKDLLEKNIHYFKNLNIGCILMNTDTNEISILNYPKKEELIRGSQYLYALTETIICNSKVS